MSAILTILMDPEAFEEDEAVRCCGFTLRSHQMHFHFQPQKTTRARFIDKFYETEGVFFKLTTVLDDVKGQCGML